MLLGLILLKYIPMLIFGSDILFDASAHLVVTCFILYIGYFFIDQSKCLKPYYFLFSILVITIVSLQRILSNNHNDFGLLLGLLVASISILITNWKKIKGEINF